MCACVATISFHQLIKILSGHNEDHCFCDMLLLFCSVLSCPALLDPI